MTPAHPRRDIAPARADGRLTVALVSEVFWQPDGHVRLKQRLAEAAERGADLAVLPELALNAWSPAFEDPNDDDAEPTGGPRAQALAQAAAEAQVGVVGGVIHRAEDGTRTNRSLIFDRRGTLVATYDKLHVPEEPGFWETRHYEPGDRAPEVIEGFGVPIGVQICSDTNRPEGTYILGAKGAMAIVIPRSTEERTFQRWKTVFRANALTASVYVLSVNRPEPEHDVPIGGPSIAFDPDGQLLVETTERLALVIIEASEVLAARRGYPGHLPIRARLYADAWDEVARRDG